MGVLDLQGDLTVSGQANSTTAGTEGERMGGQTGMTGVPEIVLRKHTVTVKGFRRGH